jgi:ParB family chromosome partitioning protein
MGKKEKLLAQLKKIDEQQMEFNYGFIDKIVDIKEIKMPEQSRKFFDEEKINELAASIEAKGLINPIILHVLSEDEYIKQGTDVKKYLLVAGERRVRAVIKLKHTSIKARDKRFNSVSEIVAIQLIENIQRENLSNYEKASSAISLLRYMNNWEEMSVSDIYHKLLSIKNKKTVDKIHSLEELSKIGLSLDTLIKYARMLNYPKVILDFFEKNPNIPFKYIEKFYTLKDSHTEKVLEIFKAISNGQIEEKEINKFLESKSKKNKKSNTKKQVRALSLFKKINKTISVFVEEQSTSNNYIKDKEKLKVEIQKLEDFLEKLKTLI